MARKLQIKRGNKVNLPTLAQGEFGLALDTEELFIGGSGGNKKIGGGTATETSISNELATELGITTLEKKNVEGGLKALSKAVNIWSETKTYAKNDLAVNNGKIYKSLQVGNLNHAVTDVLWWVEYGRDRYTANMLTFYCIPASNDTGGTTGKIRYKVQTPIDADGVMIRYKATEWIQGDNETTGTLIANLTQNYEGENIWYEHSGLPPNTPIHAMAFPHKKGVYNTSLAKDNKALSLAGGLEVEYTFDSINGTTVTDTSGNNRHGKATNLSAVAGKIVNAGKGNGTNTCVIVPVAAFDYTDRTICLFTKTGTLSSTLGRTDIFELNGHASGEKSPITGQASLSCASGSSLFFSVRGNSRITFQVNTDETFFICGRCKDNNITVSKNNEHLGNGVADTSYTDLEQPPSLFSGRGYSDYSLATIDQFRVYSRALEDYEITTLYNNGLGC